MNKVFLFVLLTCGIIKAQYTVNDDQLIKTVSQRIFNDSIFVDYLNSGNIKQVNAALMGLGHSRDTALVDLVISPDFMKHSEYILFALGQLGPSTHSTKFLLDILSQNQLNNEDKSRLFTTLGLTADSSTSRFIINNYHISPGIPTGLVNFHMRGITDSLFIDYLSDALYSSIGSDLKYEILYALYRLGPNNQHYDILIDILKDTSANTSTGSKLYALGCLRKIRKFDSARLFDRLLDDPDWRVRVEAAKAVIYYKFKTDEELNDYLTLLEDKNPNVSRAAASSLKEAKINPEQLSYLIGQVFSKISDNLMTQNTAGEAFVSLCSLTPESIPTFIDEIENDVKPEYINRALSYYNSDPNWVYSRISDQLPDATEKELMSVLYPLLDLQSRFITDEDYIKTIITLLNSEYPSTVSIVADGLDSVFVYNNSRIIQQVILEQCFKYMHNPQYVESLMSLINLSSKISKEFESSIVDMLASSKLLSVKSYLVLNYNPEYHWENHKLPLIDSIISKAFEYNSATVKTEKGSFTMKLLPQYAPVSVENFCKLAEEKYFDGVTFHRVVPNFVIQTGDPSGTGWGGPGYEIMSEFSPLNFLRGRVGMASAGFDTEGSQWFVMHGHYPHLNGRYSVFAEIINGMEIIDIIDQDDRIISIELFK